MKFPITRPRRLRKNQIIRDMVAETTLSIDDFVYPIFVIEGKDIKNPVKSMPGIYQLSLEHAVEEAKEAYDLGIKSIILFGIPEKKDEVGSQAYAEDGIIAKAINKIKSKLPDLIVIADACLCEYTSHGHCGILDKDGNVLNDPTLELLKKEAYVYAKMGADIIAPSGMMDGMVKAIRESLDENGFEDVAIMSYSAKYSSSFYGPFRDAAESAPAFGDRKSYQMDFRNANEAIKEIMLDIEEGADFVMVKPALAYLDVIRIAKEQFPYMPIAAYNVSGEYSMVKAAGKMGWVDENSITIEILTAIKRAGADLIITYFAKDMAKLIRGQS
ncbi:porphobilinogen synthase [Hippea maritima]|uniref:Delta-aminolevulinic acid dehydratase n=1 Tax=Hippea maritima (strain ATCC 700847 / DSM 10411 / MH2) TaxID=760142 RepID=F2LTI6_HIPMA|nr:porphobilinogen synthase [Hippea maritima]AEA33311.1 Porphobilinogen synthase [Hippea maritima DSM 10411]